MGQLDDKVILLTGGASGMGENHAKRLVAEGALLILTDIAKKAGEKLAASLGENAAFVHHDVSVEGDWDRAVSTAAERFGGLHGLVNNAGILRFASLEEEDPAGFERLLQVNLMGSWWGMRKVAPLLREAGGGSIVNISSTSGMKSYPGLSSYMASKWAIRGLTKVAAQEFGGAGIRVNSVHPGGIEDTGMFGGTDAGADAMQARAQAIPLKRFGTKDDISNMVIFLLSDASSYLSGAELVVDGGSVV